MSTVKETAHTLQYFVWKQYRTVKSRAANRVWHTYADFKIHIRELAEQDSSS